MAFRFPASQLLITMVLFCFYEFDFFFNIPHTGEFTIMQNFLVSGIFHLAQYPWCSSVFLKGAAFPFSDIPWDRSHFLYLFISG